MRCVADEKASKAKPGWIDLRNYPMSGVEVVDRYTYRVRSRAPIPSFPTGWRCLSLRRCP
jgi:hypothetical protein